jgi:hypothetical protein
MKNKNRPGGRKREGLNGWTQPLVPLPVDSGMELLAVTQAARMMRIKKPEVERAAPSSREKDGQ